MDPFKDQKSFKISEEGQRNLLVQKKFRENFFAKGFVVKLGKASKKWGGASRLPFSFFEMENESQCH